MRREILAVALAAALAGCDGQTGPAGPAPGMIEGPLAPAKVNPFKMGRPDLVMLVTGGTNGMMEVCNCAGPMLGGLARRSGLVRSYRAAVKNVFLLDLGDVFWIEPEDIRNRYVLRGYDRVGYDAVILGDQEWACALLDTFLPTSGQAYLSSNIRPAGAALRKRVVPSVIRRFGPVKLAVLSYLSPEAFRFTPEETAARVAIAPLGDLVRQVARLKASGHVVVIVAHVEGPQVQAVAEQCGADLVIRGHTTRCAEALTRYGQTPVAKIGGGQYVGVLAMKLTDAGRVAAIEYRVELVNEHWPMDKRLIQTYQAYAHVAMRQALGTPGRAGLNTMPSADCGKCHKTQYAAWSAGPHAGAYKTLQRVKRTGDPNCLTCHTTGFGTAKGFRTLDKTPKLAGVNCQNCHRFSVTADHKSENFKATRPRVNGEVCTTCHTPVTDPKSHFASPLESKPWRHR